MRAIGCGHASENAALFGDDIAFERFLVTFDPGDEALAGAQRTAFEAVVGAAAVREFLAVAPSVGPVAVRASCEVAVALGTQLGLPAAVVESFGVVFERWDGRGLPNGRAGEALHPIARIVGVAEQAAIAHALGGVAAARSEIARRSGGHLDPSLCEVFLASADEILAPIEEAEDLVDAVRATEQPYPSKNNVRDQLLANADGSFDFHFGPTAPGHEAANWIQTVPGKGWFTILRLYGPLEPWFEQTWRPGEIELT